MSWKTQAQHWGDGGAMIAGPQEKRALACARETDGGTWTCATGALREAAAAEQFASLQVALEELRPEPGGEVIVLLFFFESGSLLFQRPLLTLCSRQSPGCSNFPRLERRV